MRDSDRNNHELEEFARFLGSAPLTPRPKTDEAVMRRVRRGLKPSPGSVVWKLLAIQVSAGLLTLAICPQFGLGPASHNGFLHSLHAGAHPFLYYLFCGVLFVLFGALISGMVSNRRELKILGRGRYVYYAGYSAGAYLVLQLLGTESFLAASLFWILGGLSGHLIGFGAGRRLRSLAA